MHQTLVGQKVTKNGDKMAMSCNFLGFFLTIYQKTGNEKKFWFMLQILIQLRFRHVEHFKRTICTSFLKEVTVVGKKMTRNSRKMANSKICDI